MKIMRVKKFSKDLLDFNITEQGIKKMKVNYY